MFKERSTENTRKLNMTFISPHYVSSMIVMIIVLTVFLMAITISFLVVFKLKLTDAQLDTDVEQQSTISQDRRSGEASYEASFYLVPVTPRQLVTEVIRTRTRSLSCPAEIEVSHPAELPADFMAVRSEQLDRIQSEGSIANHTRQNRPKARRSCEASFHFIQAKSKQIQSGRVRSATHPTSSTLKNGTNTLFV